MASEESDDPQPQLERNRIKVLVRLKPVPDGRACCIAAASAKSLSFSGAGEAGGLLFEFDRVFPGPAAQQEVFDAVRPVVAAALEGGAGTIFSYGQTGSGKTHTLIGDIFSADHQGIVPRAAAELFAAATADGQEGGLTVSASAAEIYCERIRDLLSFSVGSDNLAVTQERDGSVALAGAQQQAVSSVEELLRVMQAALANRAVAATGMNATSSRSHCLVLLTVQRRLPGGGRRCGKLWLVDLAGSERQARTQAAGRALEEAKLINRSLSALGNVVAALSAQCEGGGRRAPAHVPFRDSKLTRLLQDSLGGPAKTAIVVCCSPAAEDAGESLSSLRFGARAAGIVNAQPIDASAACKSGPDAATLEAELQAARQECEELRTEKAALQVRLQAAEGGDVPPSAATTVQGMVLFAVRGLVLACLLLSHFWGE